MTLPLLAEKKRLGEPIVMVTAYDYPSARAAEAAGVDLVLVGDSAATTVLGYNSTTPVELDDMLVLARAVRRGLRTPLLIGDLPFGSYEVSDEQAIASAVRMVKEAGCEAVKLEGGGAASVSRARAIVGAGIPVMGHVGLTPQTRDRARRLEGAGPHRAAAAARSAREALALQEAGCFALVFEAIPAAVTEELMAGIEIPVIGIGAGPADRRAGARVPRPARHPRRARPALRQALRQPPGGDERGRRPPTPRTCARGATPALSTPTRSTPPSWRSCARCWLAERSIRAPDRGWRRAQSGQGRTRSASSPARARRRRPRTARRLW